MKQALFERNIQVIVKVAERCNLKCSYCYMYESEDQTWRDRPRFLSYPHQQRLVYRIQEHLDLHQHSRVVIELHGGEPFLLGLSRMRKFLALLHTLPDHRTTLVIQTNATLLNKAWLALFRDYNVHVGISCDGPPEINDAFRIHHDGRGSGQSVEAGIKLAVEWGKESGLFGGVLVVGRHDVNAGSIIEYFYNLGIRRLDILMPDANHVAGPSHLPDYSHDRMLSFMSQAFDRWIQIQDPAFVVRMFREMMFGIVGNKVCVDSLGGSLSDFVVIESDGSYQLLDVLRICGYEAVATRKHLDFASLDEYFQVSKEKLPDSPKACHRCRAYNSCGGGYVPHRFDGKSYDNPSFYCPVLLGLHDHIKNHMINVTPPGLWK